jgi:hypothetical protein
MSTSSHISATTFLERIIKKQGHEYAPKGLVLHDPITVERWVETVRDALLPDTKRAMSRRTSQRKRIGIQDGIVLHYLAWRNKLRWYIARDAEIIGAGRLIYYRDDICYAEDYAALFHSELRGRRLYARILHTLSAALDVPIDSSVDLKSVSALRAWKHMGLFWPERNRFRYGKELPRQKPWANPRPHGIEWCPAFRAEDLALFLTRLAV